MKKLGLWGLLILVLTGCQLSVDSPNADISYDSEMGFSASYYLGGIAVVDSLKQSGRFDLSWQPKPGYQGYLASAYLERGNQSRLLAQYRCSGDCGALTRPCFLTRYAANDAEIQCADNPILDVSDWMELADTWLVLELCPNTSAACELSRQRIKLY